MIQCIKKKDEKKENKCRSQVLEVRGKGSQDMSTEAGHRRSRDSSLPGAEGRQDTAVQTDSRRRGRKTVSHHELWLLPSQPPAPVLFWDGLLTSTHTPLAYLVARISLNINEVTPLPFSNPSSAFPRHLEENWKSYTTLRCLILAYLLYFIQHSPSGTTLSSFSAFS